MVRIAPIGAELTEREQFGKGDLFDGTFFQGPIVVTDDPNIQFGGVEPAEVGDPVTLDDAVDVATPDIGDLGPARFGFEATGVASSTAERLGGDEDVPGSFTERGTADEPAIERKNQVISPEGVDLSVVTPDINIPGTESPALGPAAAILGLFVLLAIAVNAAARGVGRGAVS